MNFIKKKRVTVRLFILLMLGGLLISLLPAEISLAQYEIAPGWSEPLNLSDTPSSSSTAATIVADPYGSVHVFWSESLGGGEFPDAIGLQSGNSIIYRRLKDGMWSESTDIFYGGPNSRLADPWAIVDESGYLHLIWLHNGSLRYSNIPLSDSTNVRAWALPVILSSGWIGQAKLLNLNGEILAFYTLISGENPGFYIVKIGEDDRPLPTLIWTSIHNLIPQDISITIDGKGRLHAVWSESQHLSPAGLAVYYSTSLDGGTSWEPIREVARATSEEDSLQHAYPWVAAHGDDEIHLQWAQGLQTYRWHQLSRDGGVTWNRPYQIWPDLISQTRSYAVGEDGNGNLYWADVLRYPNGAYLIRWTGREWQRPELFFSIVSLNNPVQDYRINTHHIRLAIAQGNELHIVFEDQDKAEVWYMHRSLPALRIPEKPVPVVEAEFTPTPTAFVFSPSPTPEATQPVFSDEYSSTRFSLFVGRPGVTLLASILPVMSIITILAIKRVKR